MTYNLYVQGEAPRERLLKEFRDDGFGVLLGTTSFWEGVDVKGEALRLVGALEDASEHPIAQAIASSARAEVGDALPAVEGFTNRAGLGVEGVVDGHALIVGRPALLADWSMHLGPELNAARRAAEARGQTAIAAGWDGHATAVFVVADTVKDDSITAIAQLKAIGLQVAMITGDAREVADAVAADLGIDEVFAEVLPQDKDAAVTTLQDRGHTVAMVGDGVNDAPALARADVGIAIGAGTDVAIESAGIVLASNDPRAVVAVRRLSAATYRKMLQNLWWAAGYNLAAIPLAAGVLAFAGIVMPMAVGAILMSASTVVVAFNAQLLRRVDLRPEAVRAA